MLDRVASGSSGAQIAEVELTARWGFAVPGHCIGKAGEGAQADPCAGEEASIEFVRIAAQFDLGAKEMAMPFGKGKSQ